MFLNTMSRLLRWLWEQTDTLLALLLGLICSILGILGLVQSSILVAAALGTLTVIAFALMRDRGEREKLQKRLDQLISKFEGANLDDFFTREPSETTLLQEAEQEIWMVQETGLYVIESRKSSFVSFLKRGGIVRIVVIAPEDDVVRWIAYRSHDYSPATIIYRAKLFRDYIDTIMREVGENAERLQVRYIPHPVDCLSVIVDPTHPQTRKRKAVVRYPGFLSPFEERLAMNIEASKTAMVFHHHYQAAQRLFLSASKVFFVVGTTHSGKTAMITRLIDTIKTDDQVHLFSIISYTFWKGSKPIGREIKSSTDVGSKTLVTYRSDGNHVLNEQAMYEMIAQLEVAYQRRKIIIIDEIIFLQLLNARIEDLVKKIIEDPLATLFATLTVDADKHNIPLFQRLLVHYRSTVIRLKETASDRNEAERVLKQELEASLYTTKSSPLSSKQPA